MQWRVFGGLCWIFPDPCLTGDSGLLGPSLTSPPQDKDRAQVPQGEQRGGGLGGEPRPHSASLPLTSGCPVSCHRAGVRCHQPVAVLGWGPQAAPSSGSRVPLGVWERGWELFQGGVPAPRARSCSQAASTQGRRQSALSGPQGCLSGSGPGMCKRGPFYGKPISLDSELGLESGPASPLGSWEP